MSVVRHLQKYRKCKVRQAFCDYVIDTAGDVGSHTASMKVVSTNRKNLCPL